MDLRFSLFFFSPCCYVFDWLDIDCLSSVVVVFLCCSLEFSTSPCISSRPIDSRIFLSSEKKEEDMGVDHQYFPKTPPSPNSSPNCRRHAAIAAAPNFFYERSDFTWNNPTELNLLDLRKAPMMASVDERYYVKLLPCIRRLYTIFNALCPNVYRIYCSDSSRVLQEMMCLIEEYLHVHPLSTISIHELIYNEDYFYNFVRKLKLSSPGRPNLDRALLSSRTEIRCFGQGIHARDENNQLHQTLLFCFELKSPLKNDFLFPVEVRIADPEKNPVANDTKYINCYHHGFIKLFSCSYTPVTQAGLYTVAFFANNVEISTEPWTVFIRSTDEETDELVSVALEKLNGQGKTNYFPSRAAFCLS